jgi:hypothetical protein
MWECTMAGWHRRIAIWMSALAICVFVAASVRPPPPVDAAMVERAVAGAEWLAGHAAEMPDRVAKAAVADDLTNWLLIVGGADKAVGYLAFDAYLSANGYENADGPVRLWLSEFPRVLGAHEATLRLGELRPINEIQAEINALPTVALDKAGETERDALLGELIVAATPERARIAVEKANERIGKLLTLAGLGDVP